jgi:DNA-binding NarL/FixJ family response regulator
MRRQSLPSTSDAVLVLIAEHMDLLYDGLAAYVERLEPDAQIVRLRNWTQLADQLEEMPTYSLLILDGDLPGTPEAHADGSMPRRLSLSPLVLLTGERWQGDLERAFKSGVKACIPLDTPAPIVIAALALALHGQSYVPNRIGAAVGLAEAPFGTHHAAMPKAAQPLDRLTRRQHDVLRQLAAGKSNAEIAADLGIAESTVRLHLRQVYRHLGVRNRVQAMRAALNLAPTDA